MWITINLNSRICSFNDLQIGAGSETNGFRSSKMADTFILYRPELWIRIRKDQNLFAGSGAERIRVQIL